MKKEKRLLIKKLKTMDLDGVDYICYEDGIRKHDVVHLTVDGDNVTVSVSCTSKLGPDGGSKASFRKINNRIRAFRRERLTTASKENQACQKLRKPSLL